MIINESFDALRESFTSHKSICHDDRGYGSEDQRERERRSMVPLGKFYWEETKKTSHEKYQSVGHNSICTDILN